MCVLQTVIPDRHSHLPVWRGHENAPFYMLNFQQVSMNLFIISSQFAVKNKTIINWLLI
jgi:hypothetical protein